MAVIPFLFSLELLLSSTPVFLPVPGFQMCVYEIKYIYEVVKKNKLEYSV